MRKIVAMTAAAGFAFTGLAVAVPTAAHAVAPTTYAVPSDAATSAVKTVEADCAEGDRALNYDISANENGNASLARQPQVHVENNVPYGWEATFLNPGGRIVVTCFGHGFLA